MNFSVKEEGKYKYIDVGTDNCEPIVLLHGLMGGLGNFSNVIDYFSKTRRILMPTLPIYELPLHSVSLGNICKHISDFIDYKGFDKVHLVGNSLGGHIALMYTLEHQDKVASMTLTGSSGLYENAMGTTFPKRSNYEFIKKKTQETFYSPETASQELIDEVFSSVNDRNKAIRILMTSKSAIRHNLSEELSQIKVPTLLIWGKQDTVTPPFVGEKFNELIKHSKLVWIDKCGHAPMMEHPELFNTILQDFFLEVSTLKLS
jgi:2-hydroxy-6-oxonona-2,4-dienedioate hydrolase